MLSSVFIRKILLKVSAYIPFHAWSQARVQFQNEYEILCNLPPHANIIHMYAFFFDRANPDVSPEFKRVGRNMRTMSLFLLMDEHPMSMREQLDILVGGQGPKVGPGNLLALYLVSSLLFYIILKEILKQ